MDRLQKIKSSVKDNVITQIFEEGDHRVFLLFLLLIAAFFGHSLSYDFFAFDDGIYLTESPLLDNLSLWGMIKTWNGSRTPVVYNVWQMLAMVFGKDNALAFRLLNIVFHLFNVFGGYLLMRYLVKMLHPKWVENKGKLQFALIASSILLIIHPIQAESVIWISSFRGTLAATFGILSVIFYLLSRNKKLSENGTYVFIFVSFMTYILGLLAKPNIVTIPLLFIALDFVFYKLKPVKILFFNSFYFIAVTVISLIHMVTSSGAGSVTKMLLRDKLTLMLEVFRFSVSKILIPINYSFDYQLNPENMVNIFKQNILGMGWMLLLFYIVVLLVVFVMWKKREKMMLFGVSFYLIFFIINSGLISFIFQNISTVANRYQYVPLIGCSIIGLALIYRGLIWKEKIVRPLVIILLLMLSIRGLNEGLKWKNSETILETSYVKHKNSYPLNIGLGVLAKKRGDYKLAQKYFEEAYKAGEFYNESYVHLLEIYGKVGEKKKASEMIQKAFDLLDDRSGEVDTAILKYYFDSRQYLSARDQVERAEHFTQKNPIRANEVKIIKDELSKVFDETSGETFRRMGVSYYNKNDFPNALIWIKASLKVHYNEKLDRFKRYLEYRIKGGAPKEDAPVSTDVP